MKRTIGIITTTFLLILIMTLPANSVSGAAATIESSSNSGFVDSILTIRGSGFTPNTAFDINFDGIIVSDGTDTIASNGGLFKQFEVPPLTRGTHLITATTMFETSNSVSYNVTPDICLGSLSGEPENPLIVNGFGFNANTEITVSFDGTIIATDTTNAAGSFDVSFLVPQTSPGIHEIRAWDGVGEALPVGFSIENLETSLIGLGTATVDGTFSAGEWDAADSLDFPVYVPEGGTTVGTLYVMNNKDNLFLAIQVPRSILGDANQVFFEFDNDNDGVWFEEGHDCLLLNQHGFSDEYRDANRSGLLDTNPSEGLPGTQDGQGIFANNGTYTTFEISHPLNSADDAHDFSLENGDRVSFFLGVSINGGRDSLFPYEFGLIEVAGTNHITINYEDNYSYSASGDSLLNHAIIGTQNWWATGRNDVDTSEAVIKSPILTLDSDRTFDSMISPTPDLPNPPLYQWTFGDIPEDKTAGVTLTKNNQSFTPGFDVSRSITPYGLTASGKQYLTISVTPRESADQLWVDIYAGPHGPVTGLIANVIADYADIGVEGDKSYAWISINHPQIDTPYELTVEIDSTLSPGILSAEYMPRACIRLLNHIPGAGETLGSQFTHEFPGLGTWTWSAEGGYIWSSADHYGKFVELTERFTGSDAPEILSLIRSPVITSVDTNFLTQPVIRVADHFDDPVGGILVTASLNNGTGILRGTLTAITDVNGLATFTDLGYSKAGEIFSIHFVADNLFVDSNNLEPIAAGSISSISIDKNPVTEGSVDSNLKVQPVIKVSDQFDNPVSGAAVTAFAVSDRINNYSLTLKVIGQGTTSPGVGIYNKAKDSMVSVTATPASGWQFSGWVGNVTSSNNRISFTMNRNITLTAVFEPALINRILTYAVEHTPTSYPYLYGHQPFVDTVEEATSGAITTEIFPSSSLMTNTQTWDGVKDDIADMGWINATAYPLRFVLSEINMLPFMFPNATVGSRVSWEIFNKYPEIRSLWQDNKILTAMTSDPYFLVSPRQFYKTPADFYGKKIRTFNAQSRDFIEALNGAPVSLSKIECYEALQRGIIDGMLIRAEDYVNFKIYEIAPYITDMPALCDYYAIAMNLNVWNSYPKYVQDQILSVSGANAAAQFGIEAFDKAKDDMISRVQAAGGTVFKYTIGDSEKQAFLDVVQEPIWNHWVADQSVRGFTQAQQILDDTWELSQQYANEVVGAGSSGGKANEIIQPVVESVVTSDNLLYSVEHSPTSYPFIFGHQPFTEAINEATHGAITNTIYPSETLLLSKDTWDGVMSGIADMGWINTKVYPSRFPLSEVNMLPFMFPDATVGSRVSWEIFNKYPEIQSQWQGNKILTTMTSDPYFMVSRAKCYQTLEDFKGQKIRIFNNQSAQLINAMGAASVSLPLADCYVAIERGVIDGALIRAEQYLDNKLYEVAPYITYAPFMCEHYAIAMNWDTWNSYPSTIQNQIMSVAGDTAALQFGYGAFDKVREDMIPIIQAAGVHEYTLSESEQQRMVLAIKPVWDKWVSDQVARGCTNAQQILDDTLALSQEYANGGDGGGGGDGSSDGYLLTLKVIGKGIITPNTGAYIIEKNKLISINAVPDPGWQFSGWLGSVTETTNTISIAMIQNMTETAVFEPIPGSSDGILRGTLTAISDSNGLASFTDLGYNRSGEPFLIRFASGNLVVDSAPLSSLTTGEAAQVRVETAANGSGELVGTQNLSIGNSLKVYSIVRDQYGNYISNTAPDSWSLVILSGTVENKDLVPASDGLSAIFTASKTGTAKIRAELSGSVSVNSGTITVKAASSGGGGGGGSEPPPVKLALTGLTSNGTVYTTKTGAATAKYQLKTGDGLLTLDITGGTIMLIGDKKALTTLSAEAVTSPPALPDNNVLVLAYKLGPEGATFNPPLTLTLSYNAANLPKRVDEEKLYIAYYDGTQWQSLESTVDQTAKTVTAKVGHFSVYALLGIQMTPSPANFILDTPVITPAEAEIGQDVNISMSISNTGESNGSYSVQLKINNEIVSGQTLTLDGGKSQTIYFMTNAKFIGTNSVDINGKAGQFIVKALPTDTVSPEKEVTPISIPTNSSPAPTGMAAAVPETPKPAINWWIISICVVITIIVTGIIFSIFLLRRKSRS